MSSNETILVMVMQGMGIFLASVFMNELLERILVAKNRLCDIDKRIILLNIIMPSICVINLFINCTFLSISERVDYGKVFFIAYLIDIVFNAWTYRGAKYNDGYIKKQKIAFMITSKILIGIFIIYTIAKYLI